MLLKTMQLDAEDQRRKKESIARPGLTEWRLKCQYVFLSILWSRCLWSFFRARHCIQSQLWTSFRVESAHWCDNFQKKAADQKRFQVFDKSFINKMFHSFIPSGQMSLHFGCSVEESLAHDGH